MAMASVWIIVLVLHLFHLSNSKVTSSALQGQGILLSRIRRHHLVTALDRAPRKALANPERHWPDGVIPYMIDGEAGFTVEDRLALQAAMFMWMADTCLTFRPATPDDIDYVTIKGGDSCWSNLGRRGGQQFVILNKDWCRDLRTMMHELGHTIGLYHEQNRADRDDHVTILWNNIEEPYKLNFKKQEHAETHGSPYDYHSIMHYRQDEFARARGKNTIQSLHTSGDQMGHLEDLSFYDIRTVSLMYQCYKKCGVYIPSMVCREGTDGFMGKDCQCYTLENYRSHIVHD